MSESPFLSPEKWLHIFRSDSNNFHKSYRAVKKVGTWKTKPRAQKIQLLLLMKFNGRNHIVITLKKTDFNWFHFIIRLFCKRQNLSDIMKRLLQGNQFNSHFHIQCIVDTDGRPKTQTLIQPFDVKRTKMKRWRIFRFYFMEFEREYHLEILVCKSIHCRVLKSERVLCQQSPSLLKTAKSNFNLHCFRLSVIADCMNICWVTADLKVKKTVIRLKIRSDVDPTDSAFTTALLKEVKQLNRQMLNMNICIERERNETAGVIIGNGNHCQHENDIPIKFLLYVKDKLNLKCCSL